MEALNEKGKHKFTGGGGTFDSATGGTFQSDTGGTFHSDTPGTFESDMDGTFKVSQSILRPILASPNNPYHLKGRFYLYLTG